MTIRLTTYRHLTAGFTIPLPSTWERAENAEGVALVAVEPERLPWFRANVVVTIEQLPADMGLADWADTGLGQLDRILQGFLLLDVEGTEVGGPTGPPDFKHHTTDTGAITMEQDLTEATLGYTVTASVGTLEYDDLADLFTTVAAGLRPDPGFDAMTPVRLDAETATLQLDRETFAALLAHAAQPTGDAAHLAELRQAERSATASTIRRWSRARRGPQPRLPARSPGG